MGPMDAGGIRERVSALRSTHEEHTSTPRSTQVQGPREEVKPLLLPASLYISRYQVYKLLLELYISTMVMNTRQKMKLKWGKCLSVPRLWPSLTQEGVRPYI